MRCEVEDGYDVNPDVDRDWMDPHHDHIGYDFYTSLQKSQSSCYRLNSDRCWTRDSVGQGNNLEFGEFRPRCDRKNDG